MPKKTKKSRQTKVAKRRTMKAQKRRNPRGSKKKATGPNMKGVKGCPQCGCKKYSFYAMIENRSAFICSSCNHKWPDDDKGRYWTSLRLRARLLHQVREEEGAHDGD